MTERVVITGMGTVNPLGHTVAESWEAALHGTSGVGPITLFDASRLKVHIAAEVKNFDPTRYIDRKEVRRTSRFEQFALAAAQEAIAQAGIAADTEDPYRVAVIVASAIGGLERLSENVLIAHKRDPSRISPFVIPMMMSNGAASLIAMHHGFHGPSFSTASACASGNDGIGVAWHLIRSGAADVAITGGSEATITFTGVGAFDRLGALSRRNDDWSMTPQPFDKNRDGLVMGEGAGILVLESERHAKARGAEILAELAAYGATADAYHVTAPHPEGTAGAKAILLALETAGVTPDEVDYINAHGTATQLNDVSETRAIKRAFGEQAYRIPISSTKSMTGHMMGSTGALEAIFCVQAIREGVVPPTIHYETPDPECDLDYVPNEPREHAVEVAISNAFGFGGHNAILVFRKYTG
ncbi:MAG TPA: beta-ketoacyl-[acyl-carrier-protein] synthase II [Chloroflexi bacterium]|nr:beta-ketoacyl-[acyl-carrier-protein] synthase II [Chloroflexota bacterium]